MTFMDMNKQPSCSTFFSAVIVAVTMLASATVAAESTRESMRLVYAALSELLPAAFNESSFESESSTERLASALEVLENSAEALVEHVGESPTEVSAEFMGLARSFENNVALLRQSFDYHRYNEFNYLLLDLTHNCVSCHSRLPADSGPPFATDLVEQVDDEFYTDVDRAQLLFAIRRFDEALSTLESIIRDLDIEPIELELDGVLFDYLANGITVTRDVERIQKTLADLKERNDLPYYMSRYAGLWSEHLDALQADLIEVPNLSKARDLFRQSLNLSPIPSSQVRMVYDLVVSAMLRRLLEQQTLQGVDLAEVYWMLGVISIRTVNPRPGVPHTELLLESAIRAAPGSEYARLAYALLEEYNRVSFAGIPTAELPEPVLNLHELAKLAGVSK
ncbi:MAG: hypothetical protein DHS20C01_10680 [marine bacterium B5-7]|nr:MAG: hypothetical protein DHS20C01_10680 [marine bacterium B5-7]